MKTLDIWELTVPFETNIKKRHIEKQNKYAHFVTDIKCHKASVTAFEIGAHGYLSKENIQNLKHFHRKYCMKTTTQKQFISNISSLSLISSYYIFNCRMEPTWSNMGYLSPLF